MNKEFKIIDLTHRLLPEVPSWNGSCGFELSIDTDYKDCTPPNLFRTQKISMSASLGTHIDAPAHVIPNGRTVDKLNMQELITDCVVIDVSLEAGALYVIKSEVVEKFEKEHGEIKPKSFIIFYTGWDKRWGNREKYHNNHKFPSVDMSTIQLLLKRDINGIGIDTFSIDTGQNGFPAHHAILGADKYLVENVNNAKELPLTGAKIFVLPMNIKDATEASVRLIALI